MLILKKGLIKLFWILPNILLVPIGYFNLLVVANHLKLKKVRIFNFFQLDDGNLNFTAIYGDRDVFIKIDIFGKNLKNEAKAYKFLKKHKLSFSLPRLVFFKKNILITEFLRGSLTIDIFLKQNPQKYNWLVDEVNKLLTNLSELKFNHNDFLLKNILIFNECIYLIDFYFSNFTGSYSLFNQKKKIAYGHINSLHGDRKTFFEDLQASNLYQANYSYKLSEIISIIVVYEPDLEKLKEVLLLHSSTFSNSVIVNNSPEINLGDLPKNIHMISCNTNIGLASALNLGISYAKKMGFKMCALFDQDTTFKTSLAIKMINRINHYTYRKKIAIFSPLYFNLVTNTFSQNIFFRFLFLIRSRAKTNIPFVLPDFVITSGSFIPIEAIDDIGMMLDKLFIDYIDLEWCLRAKIKNYSIVSFQDLLLDHKMGVRYVMFFGRKVSINDPVRSYYLFRNAFYLYFNENMPLGWKLADFSRGVLRLIFYLFIVDLKLYSKPIFSGIRHGIKKQMGRSSL